MINDIYTEMFGATSIKGDAFHPCTLPTYQEIFKSFKSTYTDSKKLKCPHCETWVSITNEECTFCFKLLGGGK